MDGVTFFALLLSIVLNLCACSPVVDLTWLGCYEVFREAYEIWLIVIGCGDGRCIERLNFLLRLPL